MRKKNPTGISGGVLFTTLNVRISVILGLLQQRQYALIGLVSLSQHSLTCLSQDVVVGVLNHLSSHIGITDLALCAGGILYNVVQVVDGVLKTVLNSTKSGTLGGYFLDCICDCINCCISIGGILTVYLSERRFPPQASHLQMCSCSMILKFFIFPELFQLTKIILFEDGRHDLNRKEKLLSFILPLVCSIKSTAKNNGVEMRMIIHPGASGMKYADISNPCSKMLRIRRQFFHCLMCCMVQSIIKEFLI